MTKSMHIALKDLKLRRISVIYPGSISYPIHEKVEVVSILELSKKIKALTAGRG
jgi:hypothetical protein